MPLRTRRPTGQVAYPTIVVEGAEKVGKTYAALSLSTSEHVGRTFVFDLGEGSADEYAALGPYEVVDHEGTFTDLLAQVKLATDEPQVDGKPNVIVIDSATVVWESIKDWADARARKGKKARQILADDPDADVPIPMNIWTDAADRWGQLMHTLRYWDGIAILICRGKEVAKVGKDGQPVTGQTDYKIEAHKSTVFNASAHVRIDGPHRARLMAVRSLTVEVPSNGLVLPESAPLEHVVFEVLGAGGGFATSTAVAPSRGRSVVDAKKGLVEMFTKAGMARPAAIEAAGAVWADGPCPQASKDDEVSDADWAALVAAVTVALDDSDGPTDSELDPELPLDAEEA